MAVVYATIGRPDIVAGALEFMQGQTRRADLVVISAVSPADIPPLPQDLPIEVRFGPKGLPAQRNAGLGVVGSSADVVVFFDDDFAPGADYLERLEAIFESDPDIAGVNGRIVADGIGGPGFTFDDARRFLAADAAKPPAAPELRRMHSLYGCNMSIRLAAARELAFDETLPLYAWQEDIDFTTQLARRGRLVWSSELAGVHLGVKKARTPGLPMGYSQIANPVFLLRKRTLSVRHAYALMAKNLAANLLRSVVPEPWCDRRGRLVGNLRALRDLVGGTLHPGNILNLK